MNLKSNLSLPIKFIKFLCQNHVIFWNCLLRKMIRLISKYLISVHREK